MKQMIHAFFLSLILLVSAGCMGMGKPTPQDPLFYYNHTMFYINQDFDRILFKPITKIYTTISPIWIQNRVHHVFSNLDDLNVILNDILQLHFADMFHNTGRFLINSTLGVAGLFDVATYYHLPKRPNDFGLTLATWGYRKPTFIVLPLLGPSTTRDALGLAVDYNALTFWTYLNNTSMRNELLLLNATDKRRELLSQDPLVKQAFNPYAFVKDAYLKHRTRIIEERNRACQNHRN